MKILGKKYTIYNRLIDFLKKWLICSWLHKQHRCYPRVWIKNDKLWHCDKCHPCGEELGEQK